MDRQHPRRLLGDKTSTDRGGQIYTGQEQTEICCTEVGLPANGDYAFVAKALNQLSISEIMERDGRLVGVAEQNAGGWPGLQSLLRQFR